MGLFDEAEFVLPDPLPVREREKRVRRRKQAAGLFSLRKRRLPPGPADRWKWRDGETLAQYVARTDDRRVRRDDLPKDVRRVKGGAFQSRPWIGPGRAMNVNLGLWHPEDFDNDRHAAAAAAGRAAREFKKRLAVRGADIWRVIRELQGETRFGMPVIPGHVLPPLVIRTSGGFGVRQRPGEVYESVEAAWAVAKVLFEGDRAATLPDSVTCDPSSPARPCADVSATSPSPLQSPPATSGPAPGPRPGTG